MTLLDSQKKPTNIGSDCQLSSAVEQRFRKQNLRGATDRNGVNNAASEANSLEKVTRLRNSCDPVDITDEYTGKRLAPLAKLAERTGNMVLKRLVLRYEAEREGVRLDGRLLK